MFEKDSPLGSISTSFDGSLGLLVGEEIEVEEPEEPNGGGTEEPAPVSGKKGGRPGLASIFDQLARLNATEQEREQEMQFWLNQTEHLFLFFREDGKFMAMLRSPNFSRDDIEKEYNKLIRRYFRQTNDTKVRKLIDENKEMFLEEFKTEVLVPKEVSIRPYDTSIDDYSSIAAES